MEGEKCSGKGRLVVGGGSGGGGYGWEGDLSRFEGGEEGVV